MLGSIFTSWDMSNLMVSRELSLLFLVHLNVYKLTLIAFLGTGMDDADFLLAVASSDRKHLFRPEEAAGEDVVSAVMASTSTDGKPHTSAELAELF